MSRHSFPQFTGSLKISLVCILLLVLGGAKVSALETPTVAPTLSSRPEDTNAQDSVRSYLLLQEQLHAAQLAIERTRKESDAATAQMNEALIMRLQNIEQALAVQRARELEGLQSSNRVTLIVAGSFATIGFIAMLIMAGFQWRTVSRLADLSAALPLLRQAAQPQLAFSAPSKLAQPNAALMETVQRLQQRLLELEHDHRKPSAENGSATIATGTTETYSSPVLTPEGAPSQPVDGRVEMLLVRGQGLLDTGNFEEALAVFDEAVDHAPTNAEALVKKGFALESLRQFEHAVDCYDRAIEADPRLTIAYLYKGGVYNRMERFSEALECYEKALRSQEHSQAPAQKA
jgi:tetratricopeptide (TPR) repeat protein